MKAGVVFNVAAAKVVLAATCVCSVGCCGNVAAIVFDTGPVALALVAVVIMVVAFVVPKVDVGFRVWILRLQWWKLLCLLFWPFCILSWISDPVVIYGDGDGCFGRGGIYFVSGGGCFAVGIVIDLQTLQSAVSVLPPGRDRACHNL
jgi:hypothetical protein